MGAFVTGDFVMGDFVMGDFDPVPFRIPLYSLIRILVGILLTLSSCPLLAEGIVTAVLL